MYLGQCLVCESIIIYVWMLLIVTYQILFKMAFFGWCLRKRDKRGFLGGYPGTSTVLVWKGGVLLTDEMWRDLLQNFNKCLLVRHILPSFWYCFWPSSVDMAMAREVIILRTDAQNCSVSCSTLAECQSTTASSYLPHFLRLHNRHSIVLTFLPSLDTCYHMKTGLA